MAKKNLLDKLLRIERTINIYDNQDDSLVKGIDINIPIEQLRNIVPTKQDDPEYYDGYPLDLGQLEAFTPFLVEQIVPDFQSFSYILVTGGIYDW